MAIDIQLKQRLVGIAVIVSLAVIFLPMLLDGAGMVEKTEYEETSFVVPPPPTVERKKVNLIPQAEQLDSRLKAVPVLKQNIVDDANRKKDKAEKVVASEPKPALKESAKVGGDSWIAQLGSFKDQDKAFKLQKKVRAYKIAAVFIQKVVIKGVKTYRVRLGPFLYQKQAKAAVEKLAKKHKLKAVVMKHDQ